MFHVHRVCACVFVKAKDRLINEALIIYTCLNMYKSVHAFPTIEFKSHKSWSENAIEEQTSSSNTIV